MNKDILKLIVFFKEKDMPLEAYELLTNVSDDLDKLKDKNKTLKKKLELLNKINVDIEMLYNMQVELEKSKDAFEKIASILHITMKKPPRTYCDRCGERLESDTDD